MATTPIAVGKTELLASDKHIPTATRSTVTLPEGGVRLLPSSHAYEVAMLAPAWQATSPDAFYEGRAMAMIREQIATVLEVEAPIEETLLAERIAATWGLRRVTARVLDRLRDALGAVRSTESSDRERRFIWRSDQDPTAYRECRLPEPGAASTREAHRIPPEEVANAAAAVLRDQVRMDKQSLARELGRIFGFARMGNRVEAAMSEGVNCLVRSGRASADSDQLTLRA